MAYSVRITARALLEIDAALEWLAERSHAAAIRWHEFEACQMVELESGEAIYPRLLAERDRHWRVGLIRQLARLTHMLGGRRSRPFHFTGVKRHLGMVPFG